MSMDGIEPAISSPLSHNEQANTQAAGNNSSNSVVGSVLSKWNKENLLEKSTLLLRAICCFFSLISFIVMASNKHGDWENFDQYQEYKYCLAMEILAFLYSLCQVGYQVYRFNTGKVVMPKRVTGILDFAGDQVIAYLLISAVSAAIPITNLLREGADNLFTDSSAASISMAFFAFLSIAVSAIISGYKLSTQTYI